jgi:hypothetical protein
MTSSPVVLADSNLNNESIDVPTEVIAEVQTDQPQVEAPKVEQRQEEVIEVPPQPVVVKHPIGCEHYRTEVSKYNWNVEVMLRIMKAESSCNPNAVGDDYPIRGLHAPSCGLLQIRTLSGRPSCVELKDPATNIAWAYRIYQSQGYPAWSVCKTKVACY